MDIRFLVMAATLVGIILGCALMYLVLRYQIGRSIVSKRLEGRLKPSRLTAIEYFRTLPPEQRNGFRFYLYASSLGAQHFGIQLNYNNPTHMLPYRAMMEGWSDRQLDNSVELYHDWLRDSIREYEFLRADTEALNLVFNRIWNSTERTYQEPPYLLWDFDGIYEESLSNRS